MLSSVTEKILRLLQTFLTLTLALGMAIPVRAQTPDLPPGPIYVVQAGDTLWSIALRFNVGLQDLMTYNRLSNANLYVGDRLVIPGFEDLSGFLIVRTVALGDTLRTLQRLYPVSRDVLVRLNRLVSPEELYAGYGLILLQSESSLKTPVRISLQEGETLLELAVRQGVSPWQILDTNLLSTTAQVLPGDVLVLEGETAASRPVNAFPEPIWSVTLDPLPLTQGDTAQVRLRLAMPAQVEGWLAEYPLRFFELEDASQVALQGIHAMKTPGLYPLRLVISLPDGHQQVFEQMVLLQAGYFRRDPVLQVEPSTIDPAVTEPENAWLASLTAAATPQKYWQGLFQLPVAPDYCIRSLYGNRRSYNGSDFIYFHTGVDYGVCSKSRPFDIYAPAAGVVIFTGFKPVRGNATIIDHGWGIYSGFWHQEEIYVSEGDFVQAGQLIGKIGKTGRATGPHLHWEIWVNGVQANPLQWLEKPFPHE